MAYSTISKSSSHFNTKLYTGTGATQSITGLGFQPDWTWIKNRNVTTYDHRAFDVVRGANKKIKPNTNEVETTTTQELSSFDSDGFTLGTENGVNASSTNYASWNWKAGNAQGSSNTDGSINTTYTSVNTTAGFSISQYTGTSSAGTIGHGLGVAPKMILTKRITGGAEDWGVYHVGLSGATHYLKLNAQDAEASSSGVWNNTAPTSTVFSVGSSSLSNGSGTYIAYCFAAKKGFSKFGRYTGNGNADGPFLYTGFKPAFVIIKQVNTSNHWYMWDNKRSKNVIDHYSRPNTSDTEGTYEWLDFVSNGIKIRNTSGGASANGGTYVYMAWAAEPLVANVGANGIPATAR